MIEFFILLSLLFASSTLFFSEKSRIDAVILQLFGVVWLISNVFLSSGKSMPFISLITLGVIFLASMYMFISSRVKQEQE